MKSLLTIFSLLFLTSILFSQENFLIEDDEISTDNPLDFNKVVIDEFTWVLDSSYYYEGNGTEWDVTWRTTTSLRNHFAAPLIESVHGWSPDEAIWLNNDSTVLTYYENGDKNTSLSRQWNSDLQIWSDTTNYWKHTENGNLVEQFKKSWDDINNIFLSGTKAEYTYDENDNRSQTVIFSLNIETNTWLNDRKAEFSYDENDNLTQQLKTTWDTETSTWINDQLLLYGYDENNNRTSWSYQDWNIVLNEWVYDRRYTRTYDENNDVIEYTLELYSEDFSWISAFKETSIYDENGAKISRLRIVWEDGMWINDYQFFYTYNENEKLIEKLRQDWDITNAEWENNRFYTYSYTANGDRLERTRQEWEGEMWVNGYNYVYVYDTDENLIQYSKYSWDVDFNGWFNVYRYDYYWSLFEIVSTQDIKPSRIIFSPNPTNGFVNFTSDISLENARVEIYAASGKLMQTIQLKNQNMININRLPSGVYFVNILTKEGRLVKKIQKI